MESGIILVIGGARSGKSKFAEDLARELGGQVTYIATAEASDREMKERIAKHQSARPAAWKTVEAPDDLVRGLRFSLQSDVIIIDCLTVYINNLLFREIGSVAETDNPSIDPRLEDEIQGKITALIQSAKETQKVIIMVSNEVGMGLVPVYNLGRLFRDITGRMNRMIAEAALKVFWVNCGMAVELKTLAKTPAQVAKELNPGLRQNY